MFVNMINVYTPILLLLYAPINLGVQIRLSDNSHLCDDVIESKRNV